jgi:hypothetical protein
MQANRGIAKQETIDFGDVDGHANLVADVRLRGVDCDVEAQRVRPWGAGYCGRCGGGPRDSRSCHQE